MASAGKQVKAKGGTESGGRNSMSAMAALTLNDQSQGRNRTSGGNVLSIRSLYGNFDAIFDWNLSSNDMTPRVIPAVCPSWLVDWLVGWLVQLTVKDEPEQG